MGRTVDIAAIRAAQGCDAGAVRVAGGDAVSADRCSFCERSDVPLVRAKHAATCVDCARLAVEVLSPPSTARGFSVVCDCDHSIPEWCRGIGGWRTGPIEAGGTDEADPCDCPCHGGAP